MPYATRKRKGKLVNINKKTGRVHGTFPDTAEGHRRAGGQIAIMARAMGEETAPRKRGRKRGPWGRRKLRKLAA